MRGLDFALNDIGLAVFTTLAPAATFAYVVLALLAMFGSLTPRERSCLESWLILPLALATVGLIASATHLGNPANALYVFRAVGRSPLSTEVLAAVVFLGTSCSYWLACIYFKSTGVIRRLWLGASIVTAFVFVWGTANAYDMDTVVTWTTLFARVNLVLTGLAGCCPLACLVLVCTGQAHRRPRLTRWVAAVSLVGALLACISMFLQNNELALLRNGYGTAAELVPLYPVAIVAFALSSCGATVASLAVLRRFRCTLGNGPDVVALDANSPAERRAIGLLLLATLVSYMGTFAVRFSFYCFHMTSGAV